MGYSMLDPCVLTRVRMFETQMLIRGRKRRSPKQVGWARKTHAWKDGNVLNPKLERKVQWPYTRPSVHRGKCLGPSRELKSLPPLVSDGHRIIKGT